MNWAQRSMEYALMSDELLADVHHTASRRLTSGEGMSFDERQAQLLIMNESGIEMDIRRAFDRANVVPMEPRRQNYSSAPREFID